MSYTAELRLIFDVRVGLVLDVSRVRTDEGMRVKTLSSRSVKDGTAILDISVDITGKEQLEKLCMKFNNIPGVDEIQRVTS